MNGAKIFMLLAWFHTVLTIALLGVAMLPHQPWWLRALNLLLGAFNATMAAHNRKLAAR